MLFYDFFASKFRDCSCSSPFSALINPDGETAPVQPRGDYVSALSFQEKVQKNQLIITADTIIWHQQQCLGKPKNDLQAQQMLQQLSESTHEVITAVGFLTHNGYESLHAISKVTFKIMSNKDITEYIATRQPFDKAGGYGIQDTFGKKVVQNISY